MTNYERLLAGEWWILLELAALIVVPIMIGYYLGNYIADKREKKGPL